MPGCPKVWAYSEVLGGHPCPLSAPSLCCRDLRLMTQGWGLTYPCAWGTHVGTLHGCVLVDTVSAHRSVHSLGTQFCGHLGEDMDVEHEGSVCAWQWPFVHTCVGVNA